MGELKEKRIKLPSAEEIKSELPLSIDTQSSIGRHIAQLQYIFNGTDNSKKIAIVGPCSAWPESEVLRFAEALKPVADEIRDYIQVIMRIYIQKPRTKGTGWAGALNMPDPFGPADLPKGIRYTRKMMIDVADMGLPIADEMLFTHNEGYFEDLLSYLAIGARSGEDAEHRYIASLLNFPIGVKHPTSGDIETGVNSVLAVQSPHTFAHHGHQVSSTGNKYAHLLLRGGKFTGPNHRAKHVFEALSYMHREKMPNQGIVIDASHDNTLTENPSLEEPHRKAKDVNAQFKVISDSLEDMKHHPEIARGVKGWMIEAFNVKGNHSPKTMENVIPGKSITDACISFEEAATLLKRMRDAVGRLQS